MRPITIAAGVLWALPALAQDAASSTQTVAVTPDNFPRAETDNYLEVTVKDVGLGKFAHRREPAVAGLLPDTVCDQKCDHFQLHTFPQNSPLRLKCSR